MRIHPSPFELLNSKALLRMTRFCIIILALCACFTASADATYEQVQVKAQRLFDQDDWIPAGALYTFMMHERPEVTDNYGRAVIAAYAASDTIRPMEILNAALSAHVPLDSVLAKVETYAMVKSRANLYQRFMLQASREYPWLERPIEPYLLRYFTSRRNGPEMIHYAQILLRGVPENVGFLSILADGYMLDDQYDKAVETWQSIIEFHPDNYQALINLATYYNQAGHLDQALPYFQRAAALRPTPYIEQEIRKIEQKAK